MTTQQGPTRGQITIRDRIPYIDNPEAIIVLGDLQRTAGDFNFKVRVTGAITRIDDFVNGLAYTKMEINPIDDIQKHQEELKNHVLEIRKKAWHAQMEKIKQEIDKTTADQLGKTNHLEQFIPKKKEPPDSMGRQFRPTRDFLIEIEPEGQLDPKCRYALSYHVESAHSSIFVAQGDYHRHVYRYNANPPAINSAWIEVTGGDPDVTLLCNDNRADYSGNWEGVDESVYSEDGPGYWELQVYGYGLANYYKITADWIL